MLQATRNDDTTYRDRKRYAWLLSLVVPCTVAVGPAQAFEDVSGQKSHGIFRAAPAARA